MRHKHRRHTTKNMTPEQIAYTTTITITITILAILNTLKKNIDNEIIYKIITHTSTLTTSTLIIYGISYYYNTTPITTTFIYTTIINTSIHTLYYILDQISKQQLVNYIIMLVITTLILAL